MLGQPEIEQLDPRGGEHDVAGLEVAVDHAALVGSIESIGDLDADLHDLRQRDGTFFESFGQGFALQMLHDQEARPFLLTHIEERADVGVREGRDHLGFALEALLDLGRGGQVVRKHLDRDRAIETAIASQVDLTHAARTEGAENLVGSQVGSSFDGHVVSFLLIGSVGRAGQARDLAHPAFTQFAGDSEVRESHTF